MKPLLTYLGFGFAFGIAVAMALLFTPLGKRPLEAFLPVGDVTAIDFATLRLTEKPNQFLVCPLGTCQADAQAISPIFDMDVDRLRVRWESIIAAEPRIEILVEDDAPQVTYVQRSERFRFPDIITVRFIPLSPTQSTLAIYSRSVYGQKDFGVNRQRIEGWLEVLGRP